MKSIKSMIKLVVAVSLVVATLSGCALVRVNPARVTVATVGSATITLEQYLEVAIPVLEANGIDYKTEDPKSDMMVYATTLLMDELINREILKQKMDQLGIAATDEDRANAAETLQSQVDSLAQQYMSNLYSEDTPTEELIATAYEYAESLYFTEEYPYERVLQDTLDSVLQQRMLDEQSEDVVVDDSEIRARYDENVAAAKESYLETPSAFEEDYYGGTYIYVPEGVVFVKHILILLSADVQEQVELLRYEGNDEEADKVEAAALEEILPRAEEAYRKAQAGEDFDSLIGEYGEDPGMQAAPYSETGYVDLPGTELYVEGFHEAAMALENDGDLSEIVASQFGYHILKRVGTLESGPAAYEENEQTIKETLLSEKKGVAYSDLVLKWREELNVKTYEDRVDYKVEIVKD